MVKVWRPRGKLWALPAALAVAAALTPCIAAAPVPTARFEDAIAAAMARMHTGMMRPSTGDADRDFAELMIVHHQGAIDMAALELRDGRNRALRRLAEGIVVEQKQEIRAMELALSGLPARTPPAPRADSHAGIGR